MRLWYQQPAKNWDEALPIGNGRLGAMIFGGIQSETIQLNEDSVWSGKKMDRINPDALTNLPKVRQLIRDGKPEEAQRLALYALSGTPNSERSYQSAGECKINFWGLDAVTNYKRELDLEEGIAKVSFEANGEIYHREMLSSFVDNAMILHFYTEHKTPFSFDCHLERCHNFSDEVYAEGGDSVHVRINAPEGGISFCGAVKIRALDGKLQTIGEHILAEDVTEALLFIDVETSFRAEDFVAEATGKCNCLSEKTWEEIKKAHISDYRALFSRLELTFAGSQKEKEEIPTDIRLKAVQNGAEDLGLLELYFQFGRYLLISSSREGALPANLQGIWNDKLTPPWDSKYTININTEMNYWIAESGNLSECHAPLFEHLERIKENGKETAKRMYGCRGSVAHHNTDIYADTAPQDHYIPSTFWVMGEAWLATHIWEHYLYTNDRSFLEKYFDVMEQCMLFFYDFLIENECGELVTSPSLSPENTYRMENGKEGVLCESPTMDIEILHELFNGYIGACEVLQLDKEKAEKAREIRNRFPKFKIGKHGQLMEWTKDYEEPEPGHRHISHLYGVYPGSSITGKKTPELLKAAHKSLERRLENGGGHTGWSRAWIIGLWAAFGDGEQAYENLKAILSMGTFSNFMDNHPWLDGHVFQIDGNFGASAAMLEMLVQCRDGYIKTLPAVSDPIGSGMVRGIRLRGGMECSMKWEKKRVTWLQILPDRIEKEEESVWLDINGVCREISLKKGEAFTWIQE